MSDLTALGDGARVLIVGGGPAGSACALALLRGARAADKRIEVLIVQPQQSVSQDNKCSGVLSPPLRQVLREHLGVDLPPNILQTRIAAYALHGDRRELRLPLDGETDDTFACPRGELDTFLLGRALAAGAQVIQARAYDVEVGENQVTLSVDGGCISGDVLVGAFGLEPTLGRALERRLAYTAPPHLQAMVTTIDCHGRGTRPLLEDTVHAFLPTARAFEFGALIPKLDRISVVVAGRQLAGTALDRFLAAPSVCEILGGSISVGEKFRATFPNGLALQPFGDRFVTIGDAAGLVRPFKGKGIYAATITGIRAARAMLEVGISRHAFAGYYANCRDLVVDVRYGRIIRVVALALAKWIAFDPALVQATHDPGLRRALFLAVSGHGTSREVFRLCARPITAAGLLAALVDYCRGEARTLRRDVEAIRITPDCAVPKLNADSRSPV